MLSRIVSFNAPVATGDQDITFAGGTSFTPKAAIFQWSRANASDDTFSSGLGFGYGITDGTNQRAIHIVSENAVASTDTASIRRNDAIVVMLNISGTVSTVDAQASFVQWLTDGVRINWSNAPGVAARCTVMLLGGADLTDVTVGTIMTGIVTGNISETALAYQPNFGIFMFGSTFTTENAGADAAEISFGAVDSAGNQWAQTYHHGDARGSASPSHVISHTKILNQLDASNLYSANASFSSWNSNGFTLNVGDAWANGSCHIYYLVLRESTPIAKVGNSTEPGSTGNQTITTSTDVKSVIILGMDSGTLDAATTGASLWSSGMADSTLTQKVIAAEELIASDPVANASIYDTDQIYINFTSNATPGSSTRDDEASLSSVSSTGFVLNWSNIGQARPFRYITFGTGAQLFTSAITESSISVSDSNGRMLTAMRSLAESSISVSDSNARVLTKIRAIADTPVVTVSDSLARLLTANRSLADTVVVSDTLTRLLTANRVLSEAAISVSESLVRRLTANRALSEASISVSDSLSRLLIAVRALAESSISVSDTVAAVAILGSTLFTRSISETAVSVSDALARRLIATRVLSDSISVSDSLARLLIATRLLSESSIAVSETLNRIPIRVRSISESSISVSDSVARMVAFFRILAESSIPLSESLVRRLTANRVIAESSIAVSETLNRTLIFSRIISESAIVVSESLLRLLIANRSISESTIAVSDSLARIETAIRILTESIISVSDSLARMLIGHPLLSDTVIVSDSLARMLIAVRALSGPVSVSDSLVRRLTAMRTLSESLIAVSDSIVNTKIGHPLLSDTIIVSETLARRLTAFRIISQTVAVSDTLLHFVPIIRSINEPAISVSDSLARRLTAFRVIGETVFVSDVLLIVGPDYEIALYISDRGYSNPLRARIQFISRAEPFNTFYTYDSFNPDIRPFNILNMSVRLAQGEIGTFSMTIEDSAGIVDKAKIGLGVKVIIEAKKEFGNEYFKLITGFVRRIRPVRPATGALLYEVTGYGSQVIFNERIVNFKRAAKRTAVDSTIPLSTESRMQAYRLFTDLITATDILPLKGPTIQSTGRFELTAISPEVIDFIAQIAPGLTDAASVANALAEITGAIWGTDSDGNPFFRYPTQIHSGILVKDAPEPTDLAANTSVNLDAFDFDDSIDVSEGFANRLYVLNAVDTKATASSSGGLGSSTLTNRWIAQQWTATDNNVTSAAFILSRVGTPINPILGKLRTDNNGYPNGSTIASFEISVDQIETSRSTIFVNDIKTETGVITPGNKYWWVLIGQAFSDDSNTVRWHHNADLSTPTATTGYSAQLPVVDADPTKPGDQFNWVRSVFGPTYAFSTFSSVRHILTQSDSESIKQYGLIEGIVDLPAFEDDATFQKALAKIIYTSAKPKRTYEYARLTIPTQRIFYPGELITVIDSKADLTSEKNVMAEIAEVNYNFDTGSNAMGCKYVDIRLIAFLDKTLDDYMDTREC